MTEFDILAIPYCHKSFNNTMVHLFITYHLDKETNNAHTISTTTFNGNARTSTTHLRLER